MNILGKQTKFPSWNFLCDQVVTASSDKEVCGVVITALAKYSNCRCPLELASVLDLAAEKFYFMVVD